MQVKLYKFSEDRSKEIEGDYIWLYDDKGYLLWEGHTEDLEKALRILGS